MTTDQLTTLFFRELRKYNNTNFRSLKEANLLVSLSPIELKAFSSVVTRFFIFVEKHPEIESTDLRILYFKLKIDLIARYFTDYPAGSNVDIIPFQEELKLFCKSEKLSSSDKPS